MSELRNEWLPMYTAPKDGQVDILCYAPGNPRAEAAEAERDRLKAEYDAYRETSCESIDRLKAALRLWQDAWATGRNEPMAIAANATKNELGDAS